jgi:hypothetical protein
MDLTPVASLSLSLSSVLPHVHASLLYLPPVYSMFSKISNMYPLEVFYQSVSIHCTPLKRTRGSGTADTVPIRKIGLVLKTNCL